MTTCFLLFVLIIFFQNHRTRVRLFSVNVNLIKNLSYAKLFESFIYYNFYIDIVEVLYFTIQETRRNKT